MSKPKLVKQIKNPQLVSIYQLDFKTSLEFEIIPVKSGSCFVWIDLSKKYVIEKPSINKHLRNAMFQIRDGVLHVEYNPKYTEIIEVARERALKIFANLPFCNFEVVS